MDWKSAVTRHYINNSGLNNDERRGMDEGWVRRLPPTVYHHRTEHCLLSQGCHGIGLYLKGQRTAMREIFVNTDPKPNKQGWTLIDFLPNHHRARTRLLYGSRLHSFTLWSSVMKKARNILLRGRSIVLSLLQIIRLPFYYFIFIGTQRVALLAVNFLSLCFQVCFLSVPHQSRKYPDAEWVAG